MSINTCKNAGIGKPLLLFFKYCKNVVNVNTFLLLHGKYKLLKHTGWKSTITEQCGVQNNKIQTIKINKT